MARIQIRDLPVHRDIYRDELEDIFGAGAPRFRPSIEVLEQRELMASGLAAPLHFEFAPAGAPVASGYTGVSLVSYSQTQGYGWQSLTGLAAVNRNTGNPLTSDFIRGTDATFQVDLPNGLYDVTPTLGDSRGVHDDMQIWAEGQLLASGLTANAGQFLSPTYKVQVTGGQLDLRLLDTGGVTPKFALDALDIAPAPVATQSYYSGLSGVYALQTANAKIQPSVLSNPYVDGIAIRATWKFMEPTDGSYNWSYLDNNIAAAAAAGKKVSLSIQTGVDTPAWVYAEGAQSVLFRHQKIPVPWDSVYLTKWEQFITELGQRYGNNPAVDHVVLTGINETTQETLLPHTRADALIWQGAGYTRAKLEAAWQSMADTWSAAFANKQIVMDVVPNGLPAIDANGHLFAARGGGDNQAISDLINLGISRYGSQFVVQNNGLNTNWISPAVSGLSNQVTTGYQMLWYVTGDNSYRMNGGKAIDPAVALQDAVNQAVAGHARYVEIYHADVINPALQGVLAKAHAALRKINLPTATITGLPAGPLQEGTNSISLGSAVSGPFGAPADSFSYAWTVQHNGQTVATGSAPNLTFTATDSGSYMVSLQVTDASGRSSLVNTQTITVADVAPAVSQLSAPQTMAQGVPGTFSAAAASPGSGDTAADFTYTWRFGGTGATLTGSSVSYAYQRAGTYTVTLTVTDDGGASSTTTMTVTVTPPVHSAEGAPISLNAGSLPAPAGVDLHGATYAWTVTKNGAVYATGKWANFTFTPNDLSSYLVTQTVTARNGQSWTNSVAYTIDNLPPTITQVSAPLTQAQGVAATFSAAATDPGKADRAAGLTYSWKFGDGHTATGSSVSYTYQRSGTFTVVLTVTDAEGAKTTTTRTVTVTAPTHSPEGAAITLNAGAFPAPSGVDLAGATYAWKVTKNGAVYATGSTATFTFTPNDLSNYVVTLTVTDKAGQRWTSTVEYVIDNLPPTITSITAPTTASQGAPVTFAAQATDPGQADVAAGLTYSWRFGDSNQGTGSSVTHTYARKGDFTVTLTVTDPEGAKTTSTFTILVS
jgi:PKD repeat protein